jgi:hypothetical protein
MRGLGVVLTLLILPGSSVADLRDEKARQEYRQGKLAFDLEKFENAYRPLCGNGASAERTNVDAVMAARPTRFPSGERSRPNTWR